MLSRIIATLCVLISCWSAAKPVAEYLPTHNYSSDIPTPEQILGYQVGQRHVRHAELLSYLQSVSDASDRVITTEIGRTYQHRKQVLLTFSSPENLAVLDDVLAARQNRLSKEKQPLVVWLGYSVHGDEISGANAAMVIAYYLAASDSNMVKEMLKDTIIVMEPAMNPDGMDRFVNWVDTFRGMTPNADPNHIEHRQMWPTGRTNHFWFDLNRDWLLLSQQESQNRLPFFHLYQPNVLGDFHEMGPNSSYFFQPGIPSRTHPLTPKQNVDFTNVLGEYHARALDRQNRLYFTKEAFDDFYYGKGSTYPDINASVGILFEQARSRGFVQETINGLLTFEYGIENQVFTSLSTLEGAWQNRDKLTAYRPAFYQQAIEAAKDADFDGYLITESNDDFRFNVFIEKLQSHDIDVYPLAKDFKHKGKIYRKGQSVYVPLEQAQYRVVEAIFNQQKNFKDNTFYDVSGWTLPLAMNIDFVQLGSARGLSLAEAGWQPEVFAEQTQVEAYAYAFEWHHFQAPKLANNLLNSGLKLRVATTDFTATLDGKEQVFKQGTILIPTGIQHSQNWLASLYSSANDAAIELFPIISGLTAMGADIGSSSMAVVTPLDVLLVGGQGISQHEAGEVLYYLDHQLNIPVSVVEQTRFRKLDLSRYSHIVMVGGYYTHLTESDVEKVKAFVEAGGVVIGQKQGAKWLSDNNILSARFVAKNTIDKMYDTSKLSYEDKVSLAARKRIAGAIFEAKLDLSHPLTYGFSDDTLPVFRNSTLIMEKVETPFINVATYTKKPLLSGYTDKLLVNQISENTVMAAHNYGKGRVIGISDNLSFRGYWLGSSKLLANSLFFSKAFSAKKP